MVDAISWLARQIAGRNHKELEALIGCLMNTLTLRTDLSGNPTVGFGSGYDARQANQDLPFEKLIEELRPPRSLSQTPVFQVLFSFQNSRSSDLQLSGLALHHQTLKLGNAGHAVARLDSGRA